jgi:hypothetical protein
MVMRTLDEVSCALRARREKGHFNTLGESGRVAGESQESCGRVAGELRESRGRVAGGRVEALYFFLTFATIVLSPSQRLNLKALMKTLDKTKVSSIQGVAGGETLVFFLTACVWNARSRSRRAWPSASSSTGGGRGTRARAPVCGDSMGSVSGDCVGSVCGDQMGRLYWRPHGALLRRPHGFRLRRPRGALDMLHRNEEHVLKSLHVD